MNVIIWFSRRWKCTVYGALCTRTEYEIALQKALNHGIKFQCALNWDDGNAIKREREKEREGEMMNVPSMSKSKIRTASAQYCILGITWFQCTLHFECMLFSLVSHTHTHLTMTLPLKNETFFSLDAQNAYFRFENHFADVSMLPATCHLIVFLIFCLITKIWHLSKVKVRTKTEWWKSNGWRQQRTNYMVNICNYLFGGKRLGIRTPVHCLLNYLYVAKFWMKYTCHVEMLVHATCMPFNSMWRCGISSRTFPIAIYTFNIHSFFMHEPVKISTWRGPIIIIPIYSFTTRQTVRHGTYKLNSNTRTIFHRWFSDFRKEKRCTDKNQFHRQKKCKRKNKHNFRWSWWKNGKRWRKTTRKNSKRKRNLKNKMKIENQIQIYSYAF